VIKCVSEKKFKYVKISQTYRQERGSRALCASGNHTAKRRWKCFQIAEINQDEKTTVSRIQSEIIATVPDDSWKTQSRNRQVVRWTHRCRPAVTSHNWKSPNPAVRRVHRQAAWCRSESGRTRQSTGRRREAECR